MLIKYYACCYIVVMVNGLEDMKRNNEINEKKKITKLKIFETQDVLKIISWFIRER